MKFELQSVLTFRENIEQVKKRELGIAHTEKQGLEIHKDRLKETKGDVLNWTRARSTNRIDVESLKQLRTYSSYIDRCIKKVSIDIVKAEKNVSEKKTELAEAMKQRKMIEKLKEKQKEQFYQIERQKESSRVDELVSYKYAIKIQ